MHGSIRGFMSFINTMTIIEFYDKAAIENIAGALLCDPDRVILVGHNKKKNAEKHSRLRASLGRKGKDCGVHSPLGYAE